MFFSIDSRLTNLDLWLLGIFIFLIIKVVYFNNRMQKDSDDAVGYILMSRKLTLPLFVATLVSSWYGNIFAATQISFNDGVYSLLVYGFFWYFAYIVFALYLVKKIKKSQALTLPEFVSQHIGLRAGKITSFLVFIKMIPIVYAISIGVFIKNVFGIELISAVIIGVMLVTVYCSMGGFRAVVITDLMQFLVMFAGVITVIVFSYKQFGGLDYLRANLPVTHFNFSTSKGWAYPLIWFFIAISSTIISPVFYQRCFAVKDTKTARNGILISIIFWLIFDLCTTFGGLYAKAYMPNADSLDAYFNYALDILPSGAKGLFVAAVLSTILSTLDSYIFISSSVLSYDLAPKALHNSKFLRIIAIYFTGIVTILLAVVVEKDFENIAITLASYVGTLITIPIILIHFLNFTVTEKTFIRGTLLTLVCMLINDTLFSEYKIKSFYIGVSFNAIIILNDILIGRFMRKSRNRAVNKV